MASHTILLCKNFAMDMFAGKAPNTICKAKGMLHLREIVEEE